MVSPCVTDGSIHLSITRRKAPNSSHLQSYTSFFPTTVPKHAKILARLHLNKSTAATQTGGWKHLQKPAVYQLHRHPPLSPTDPVRVAPLCSILPLSGCSIMQIHCLLFAVSVTISWHESQQGVGGAVPSHWEGGRRRSPAKATAKV